MAIGDDQIAPLTEDEAIMPEERRFQVGEREIMVRPLVIGHFKRIAADLGAIASQIARDHPEIDLAHPEAHLEAILPYLSACIGRVFERIFGVEEEYLDEHLTLWQAMAIVTALLEVNRIPDIRGNAARARLLLKESSSQT